MACKAQPALCFLNYSNYADDYFYVVSLLNTSWGGERPGEGGNKLYMRLSFQRGILKDLFCYHVHCDLVDMISQL